jgi:hypothetical protein
VPLDGADQQTKLPTPNLSPEAGNQTVYAGVIPFYVSKAQLRPNLSNWAFRRSGANRENPTVVPGAKGAEVSKHH